jgi:hypothetical protein
MLRLWLDLWDLLRLRVRPLASYRHPWWLMIVVMTALGVFDSASTPLPGASIAARMAVFVTFDWLEALALWAMLLLWLRLPPRANGRPLFTLLLLCELPQALSPLAGWLPEPAGQVLQAALWGVTLALTVFGVARATQTVTRRVAIGLLLFLPLSVLLFASVTSLAALGGVLPAAPAAETLVAPTTAPAAGASDDDDFAP